MTKLKELYTHELEYIGRLAEMIVTPGETSLDSDPVREIEDKVTEFLTANQPEALAPLPDIEMEPAEDEPLSDPVMNAEDLEVLEEIKNEVADIMSDNEDSDTVVFDRLQFGKDYEFK